MTAIAIAILNVKFGKPGEVCTTHIQCITSLPVITNSILNRIQEFYEKLVISVKNLETINKLKENNGYVRLALEELPSIRVDLVRFDNNWQEWDFAKLVDSLRRWTWRNFKNILNNHQKQKGRCFSNKGSKAYPQCMCLLLQTRS